MSFWKITPLSFLLLLTAIGAKAQLTLTDTAKAGSLVRQLVGKGIIFTNPLLTCDSGASGQFSIVGPNNLGLQEGVVLTSGKVKSNPATFTNGIDAVNIGAISTCNEKGAPLDYSPLTTLAGQPTHDACRLEFDFVPDGDSILFNYVFGSEEYDAFSCTGFNDVFAFFLSGPLITGSPNIALIPGTNVPVTINSTTDTSITKPGSTNLCTSIAPGSPFVQYYNDNSTDTMITYYGLTKVLTAHAKVIPCTTYHIILAIADAGDCALDSGVFLEANSFSSNNIRIAINNYLGSNYPYIVEGCGSSTITAIRTKPVNYAQTVHLAFGGSATRNVDYLNVPDSVTVPPGDTIGSITINPIQDGIVEGDETIKVYTLHPCTGLPIDSTEITVKDYLPFTHGGDTAICQRDTVLLRADGNVADDSEWVWYWRGTPPFLGIANQGREQARAWIDTSTTIYMSATYRGCLTDTESVFARVEPLPIVNIVQRETELCLKEPWKIFVDRVKPYWFSDYAYRWIPGNNLNDSTILEPHFFSQELKTYNYTLRVRTPLGCEGRDFITLHARPPLLTLDANPLDTTITYGTQIQLYARGANAYQWTPLTNLTDNLSPAPFVRPTTSTVYTVTGFNQWGCSDTRILRINVDPSMHDDIPTAFSPNGDGRNDFFNVVNLDGRNLLEFRVFDRWGAEVFSANSATKGWDGSYKGGEPCPVGTYYYIIRVSRPTGGNYSYKGEVTLVR